MQLWLLNRSLLMKSDIKVNIMRGNIFIGKTFVPGEVLYENGIITEVKELNLSELSSEETERYIIPGLVDIHLHGCMGMDFCDCADKYDAGEADEVIGRMIEYERSVGVTAICPTTMTYDENRLCKIMKSASEYRNKTIRQNQTESSVASGCAHLLGVHLEGPFISRKRCGAQNPEYVMNPDADMIRRLNDASDDMVRLVAIAPETEGAIECIRKTINENSGIHFSIAHTDANYDQTLEALQSGADHVTHIYNAMPEFSKRAPGVVGAAFDVPSTYVELICDGNHVHPSMVRATYKMFGADRVILISDSMEATGMPDGDYELGGQKVIKRGNLATLEDGTLAGSVTNLYDCMKVAIGMGIPKEDAIISATLNPASSIGADDCYGRIAVGARALMLVCDENINILEIIG